VDIDANSAARACNLGFYPLAVRRAVLVADQLIMV